MISLFKIKTVVEIFLKIEAGAKGWESIEYKELLQSSIELLSKR